MAPRRKKQDAEQIRVSENVVKNPIRRSARGRSPPTYDKDALDTLLQNNRRRKTTQAPPEPTTVSWNSSDTVEETETDFPDSTSSDGSSEEDISETAQDIDPQEEYYRSIGYFPTYSKDTLCLIKAIIEDPEMGKRIAASHDDVANGLEYDRNVSLEPTIGQDEYIEKIKSLPSQLPEECKKSLTDQNIQDELWRHDFQKCKQSSNEALFQRTLMMTMIDRSRFFWDRKENMPNRYDFSSEMVWNCPPMPTRAIDNGNDLLSRPKPDLCVSFRTEKLIGAGLMGPIPRALRRLIQFEGSAPGKRERAFPFLSVEAKKSYTSPDHPESLHQGLNSASQALHNMYEFFREARSEDVFFKQVRYFTVSAMTKGITIRIHRAVPLNQNDAKRIVDDYQLSFEFEEFASFKDEQYSRGKVVDAFERIIWAYGSVLFEELHNAAVKVAQRFRNKKSEARKRNEAYYRHGQKGGKYEDESVAPSEAETSSLLQPNSAETSHYVDSFPTMTSSASKRPRTD